MVAETEETEDESLAIDCPVLVTDRLVLRPPHPDDIPELAVLANNRRVAEMLSRMPHPYGEAEARAFVQSIRSPQRSGCAYALTLADTGAFIGCAGLDAPQPMAWRSATGSANLTGGTAMLQRPRMRWSTWRSGQRRSRRSDVSCRVINSASRRVIHKCGFQYAGQGMMNSISAGQVPIERYRLDRKTWVSLRSWGPS